MITVLLIGILCLSVLLIILSYQCISINKYINENVGSLYLTDEGIYLQINEEKKDVLENSKIVTLAVLRKNFKGFNE